MSSACTCHIDAESCDWCKIEGIKERANNATVGPWKWEEPDDNSWSTKMPMILNSSGELILNFGDSEEYYPTEGEPPNEKDAQFITHAREDIPFLLKYIKQQQQEIERLKLQYDGANQNRNAWIEKAEQQDKEIERLKQPKQTFLIIYKNEISLVTNDPHDVAEHWNNNYRDKLQIWQDGKLIEERD